MIKNSLYYTVSLFSYVLLYFLREQNIDCTFIKNISEELKFLPNKYFTPVSNLFITYAGIEKCNDNENERVFIVKSYYYAYFFYDVSAVKTICCC